MRRSAAFLVVTLLVGFGATAAPAAADQVSGGTVTVQCRATAAQAPALPDPPYSPSSGPLPLSQPVSQTPTRGCRTVEALDWGAAAACRAVARTATPTASDPCTAVDGRTISDSQITAYDTSWVHQALGLQAGLGVNAPLWERQVPHTHNSYNSSAYRIPTDGSAPSYYPTLTNQDPNQVYSLTDQLNMDIRFLELDLHWVPSPYGNASTGGNWVTLCHGDSANPAQVHVGCSIDRPLQDGLAEIRRWMDAHPNEFVFIYFEDQLNNNRQAHQLAGQLIDQAFDGTTAPNIAKPATPCANMPLTSSQAGLQDQANHPHLLIVGNCDDANNGGAGTIWSTLVHSRGQAWDEHGDPSNYTAGDCAADEQAHGPNEFRRLFGDDTFVTAMTSRDQNVTAATAAAMTRCGVNIIGMDQLQPQDGRLQALVWSWAPNEPSPSGGCAMQENSTTSNAGRFVAERCNSHHPAACLGSNGAWQITPPAVKWKDAASACAASFPGSSFAVPVNGLRNGQLATAAAGRDVWLNYARTPQTWTPNTATASTTPAAPTAPLVQASSRFRAPAAAAVTPAATAGIRPQPAAHHSAGRLAVLLALLILGVAIPSGVRRVLRSPA